MAYSQEQESLRLAITNFIGVAAANSLYEGDNATRNVISLFLEELVKYVIKSDNTIDIKNTTPIFRACIYILNQRKQDIVNNYKSSFGAEPNTALTQDIDQLIELLTEYMNKIK